MKDFQKNVQLILEATQQDNFMRALYAAVHARNADAINKLLLADDYAKKNRTTSRII
jgi:hypothetical protein